MVRVRLPNPLAALDDRALLARFADQRDEPAFEQLVKRHGRLVFGVCRRAVRDAHLAEDAFQAVFQVLAQNPKGAAEATSVGGWLYGVARRVGLAARRHERRRVAREQANPARKGGGDPQPDFDDLLRVLDDELAALPADLRAALVACFLEEHTQDQAARELGWSLSTLRRRLDRGKELLRARLSRRGVTLGAGLLAGALASPARGAVPALAPSPLGAALAAEALKCGVGAKLLALCAGVALAVGGIAFGLAPDSNDAPPRPVRAKQPTPAPEIAPAPRPVVLKQWVTVSGRVVFPKDRAIPEPELVPAGAVRDADTFKPFAPLRDERIVIDADTRGIANAVVWLRPDADDDAAAFPADKIHPDFANPKPREHTVLAVAGQFAPHVLAARAGDWVTFDNRLGVPTNVQYSVLVPGGNASPRDFNVLVGKDMSYTSKPLAAARVVDTYSSTIHPWMRGYVRAFDHPYFAVTDANGAFSIPNAPAGKWRLVVWHEAAGWLGGAAGRSGAKVTIPASRTGALDLGPLAFASWPKPK